MSRSTSEATATAPETNTSSGRQTPSPDISDSMTFIPDVQTAVAEIELRMASPQASSASIVVPSPLPPTPCAENAKNSETPHQSTSSTSAHQPSCPASHSVSSIVSERVGQFERSEPHALPTIDDGTVTITTTPPIPTANLFESAVIPLQADMERVYQASVPLNDVGERLSLTDNISSPFDDAVSRFEAAVSNFESIVACAPSQDPHDESFSNPIADVVAKFEAPEEAVTVSNASINQASSRVESAIEKFEMPIPDETLTRTSLDIPSVPISPKVEHFEAGEVQTVRMSVPDETFRSASADGPAPLITSAVDRMDAVIAAAEAQLLNTMPTNNPSIPIASSINHFEETKEVEAPVDSPEIIAPSLSSPEAAAEVPAALIAHTVGKYEEPVDVNASAGETIPDDRNYLPAASTGAHLEAQDETPHIIPTISDIEEAQEPRPKSDSPPSDVDSSSQAASLNRHGDALNEGHDSMPLSRVPDETTFHTASDKLTTERERMSSHFTSHVEREARNEESAKGSNSNSVAEPSSGCTERAEQNDTGIDINTNALKSAPTSMVEVIKMAENQRNEENKPATGIASSVKNTGVKDRRNESVEISALAIPPEPSIQPRVQKSSPLPNDKLDVSVMTDAFLFRGKNIFSKTTKSNRKVVVSENSFKSGVSQDKLISGHTSSDALSAAPLPLLEESQAGPEYKRESTPDPTTQCAIDPETQAKIEASTEPEPDTEAAIEPEQDLVTKPTRESLEPTAKPTTEQATEPVEEPVAEPATETTTEPAVEPATNLTEKPAAKPATGLTEDLDMEPARDAVGLAAQPTTEQTAESTEELVTELAEKHVTEPATMLMDRPAAELAAEPASKLAIQLVEEPSTEPVRESEDSIAELATEQAAEPTEEVVTGLAEKPVMEPATEPAPEPRKESPSESAEELAIEPIPDVSSHAVSEGMQQTMATDEDLPLPTTATQPPQKVALGYQESQALPSEEQLPFQSLSRLDTAHMGQPVVIRNRPFIADSFTSNIKKEPPLPDTVAMENVTDEPSVQTAQMIRAGMNEGNPPNVLENPMVAYDSIPNPSTDIQGKDPPSSEEENEGLNPKSNTLATSSYTSNLDRPKIEISEAKTWVDGHADIPSVDGIDADSGKDTSSDPEARGATGIQGIESHEQTLEDTNLSKALLVHSSEGDEFLDDNMTNKSSGHPCTQPKRDQITSALQRKAGIPETVADSSPSNIHTEILDSVEQSSPTLAAAVPMEAGRVDHDTMRMPIAKLPEENHTIGAIASDRPSPALRDERVVPAANPSNSNAFPSSEVAPQPSTNTFDASEDRLDSVNAVSTDSSELLSEATAETQHEGAAENLGQLTNLDTVTPTSTPVDSTSRARQVGSPVTPKLEPAERHNSSSIPEGDGEGEVSIPSREAAATNPNLTEEPSTGSSVSATVSSTEETEKRKTAQRGVVRIANSPKPYRTRDASASSARSPSTWKRLPKTLPSGVEMKVLSPSAGSSTGTRASPRLPRVAELTGKEGREKATAKYRLPRGATFSGTPTHTQSRRLSAVHRIQIDVSDTDSTASMPIVASAKNRTIARASSFSQSRRATFSGGHSSSSSHRLKPSVRAPFGSNSGRRASDLHSSFGARAGGRPVTVSSSAPASPRPPLGPGYARPPFSPLKTPQSTPTVPQPFRLAGIELHEKHLAQLEEARKLADESQSRRYPFRPTPLPDFYRSPSKPETK